MTNKSDNFAQKLCSRDEFNRTVSSIVTAFMDMTYPQQKIFFEALTQGWTKNAFPSEDRETVAAVFEVAKIRMEYRRGIIKSNDPKLDIALKLGRIGDDMIGFIMKTLESYVYYNIKKNCSTYLNDKETCEDIVSGCNLAIYERIPAYDAYRSTPITFFNNEILAAIRKQVTIITSPVTQTPYHLGKQRAIKRAMNELAQEGLDPTDNTLIQEKVPDLSLEEIVTERTYIDRFSASNMVSLNAEEAQEIPDEYQNPEKVYLKKDEKYSIWRMLKFLSSTQQKICKIALANDMDLKNNGDIKEVAVIMDITVDQCKLEIAKMTRQLQITIQNGELGDEAKKYIPKDTVEHDNAISAMDTEFDDAVDVMNAEIISIDLDDNNDIMALLGEDGRECFTKTETGTKVPDKRKENEMNIE